MISIILILLFSTFLLLNLTLLKSTIGVVITLIIFIPTIVWLIWYTIHTYKKRIETLKLNPTDLKKYEFFDVITNLRYIRRNYFLNFLKDLSKYPKDALEQVNDIVFLKLDFVEKVIINHNIGRLLLFVREYNCKYKYDTDFYIEFSKSTFKDLLDKLSDVLNLKIIEQNAGVTVYISSNK